MKKDNALSHGNADYLLMLDDDLLLHELLKRGQYNWINRDVTDNHFPHIPCGGMGGISIESMILLCFNRMMTTPGVLFAFVRSGLKAATPHALLSFGCNYPAIQLQFSIPALGMTWRNHFGYPQMVFLCGSGTMDRRVNLHQEDVPWGPRCHFAALEA